MSLNTRPFSLLKLIDLDYKLKYKVFGFVLLRRRLIVCKLKSMDIKKPHTQMYEV